MKRLQARVSGGFQHSLTQMASAVTIYTMRKLAAQPIDASIVWFLTGLLALGSVLNVLPAVQGSQEFAEERLLEIELEDDDRNDSHDFGFVVHVDINHLASSQTWQLVQFGSAPLPDHIKWRSHLVRGPPSC